MTSPRRRSALLTLALSGTGLLAASLLGAGPASAAEATPQQLRVQISTLTPEEARQLPVPTLVAMRAAAPEDPLFAAGGPLADLLPPLPNDNPAADPPPVLDPGNGNTDPGNSDPGNTDPGNGNVDPGNGNGLPGVPGNDNGNGNGNGGDPPVDPGDPPVDPGDPPVDPPVDPGLPPVVVPPVITPPVTPPPGTDPPGQTPPPTQQPGPSDPQQPTPPPTDAGTSGGGASANSGTRQVPTGTIGKVDSTTADGNTGVPDCSSADLTCRAVQADTTSASSPATTSVSSSALPHTGIDAGSIVGLGSSMVLMGAGVTVVARRRRPVRAR